MRFLDQVSGSPWARRVSWAVTAAVLATGGAVSYGQTYVHPSSEVSIVRDSGWIESSAEEASAVLYSTDVRVAGAPWVRLRFGEVVLGDDPDVGDSVVLRVTSLLDGAVQHLDSRSLVHWSNSSAYFNGDQVRVELVATSNAGSSRVEILSIIAGENEPSAASICGVDDRVLSDDPRIARMWPVRCTGFLINDGEYSMLTAGHCGGGGLQVAEFNVPLSSPTGFPRHPGPEDQYPVDSSSVQRQSDGIGDDWAYFGVFPNSETDLSARASQGDSFQIVNNPPAPDGGTLRITGFGADDFPLAHDLAQQTDSGIYDSRSGTSIAYNDIDTQGGLSGGPVEHLGTELIYAIHTNGGCGVPGGANRGTAMNHSGLQNALVNPRGVCRAHPDCNGNLVADAEDIAEGTSPDWNENGIPDGCEQGGDATGDGDVDIADFAILDGCTRGPGEAYDADVCTLIDFDDDGDADFADFGALQRTFTGDCGVTIVQPPTEIAVCPGTGGLFEVEADGASLTYQWFRNTGVVLGATGPTLAIGMLGDDTEGLYSVRVSSACGSQRTTPVGLFTPDPPTFTMDPEDQPLCAGLSAEFAVDASGFGSLSYQWQVDQVDISGATDPTFSIDSPTESDIGRYRCVVTDDCGQSTPSGEAEFIDASVAFKIQPVGGSFCVGDSPILFATISGIGDFQWFKDGVAIPDATSFFLVLDDVSLGESGVYVMVATDRCNNATTSDEAVVEVVSCSQ
jgi:hypothetical protein